MTKAFDMAALSGKTVLLTGGSRGIGAAIAHAIKASGGRPLIHSSAPNAAVEALAGNERISESDLLFEDLANEDAGFRLFAKAIAVADRIDALVNNAGIFPATPLNAPEAEWRSTWREILAVNVQAPADLARAAIAHFREQGGGRIVNIASRAGQRGDEMDYSAYAASKGALLAMSKTWARALAAENILVYAIAPGWVATRMAPEASAARHAALAEIPLGRLAAPEEIAALVAFVLSDACPSATGATFDVNGASYLR